MTSQTQQFEGKVNVIFRVTDVRAFGPPSIYPLIQFVIETSFSPLHGVELSRIVLTNQSLKIYVGDPVHGGDVYVGRATYDGVEDALRLGELRQFNYDLVLDHFGLSKVEKIRNGEDLHFAPIIQARVAYGDVHGVVSVRLEYVIAKSKWVEKILPVIGYKTTHLIEIPTISAKDFMRPTEHLDKAWRELSMGSYDDTLVDCRQALESLAGELRSKGFARDVTTKDGHTLWVPDFKKVLGSERSAEACQEIYTNLTIFLAPGAHAGKAINREDADFALMCVHGLVNLVVRKLS